MLRALALATTLLVLAPVRGFPILGCLLVLGELWPGEDSPWLVGNRVVESHELPSSSLFLPLLFERETWESSAAWVLGRLASAALLKGAGFLMLQACPLIPNIKHSFKISLRAIELL